MLRVRFHGRGGQGIKTASRILGTSAFLEGYYVQDAPLYGAERRGAPIVAFDRISKEPVLERGIILNPDIIVVGDETLLDDPPSHVLQGIRKGGVLFVNTHYETSHILEKYSLPQCEIVVFDVTNATINTVGKASVSATLAACTCKIAGVAGKDAISSAIRKELTSIDLKPETIEKNIIAALECYDNIPEHHIETIRFNPVSNPKIVSVKHHSSGDGIPVIYAKCNTVTRQTGNWRLFKPCINYDKCVRCNICFTRCPDGSISINEEDLPVIDYTNCKGCLICYEECPAKAIEAKREVRTW